jgi:LPS-assembly protein
MVFPTHLKRRPWALALCLAGLTPSPLWAAAADWNCTRSKDNTQWVCATRKPGEPETGTAPGEAPRATPPERARTEQPDESAPPRRAAARPAQPVDLEPVQAETRARGEPPARAETPPQPETPPQAEIRPTPEPPAQPAIRAPSRRTEPPVAATPSEPAAPAELKRVPETIQAPSVPAKSAAKPARSGWTCRPGEGDETGKGWDCSLVGADPRGMAHAVDEKGESTENWAESTTITREDEQRFQKMMSLLPADPWKNVCTGGSLRPQPVSEFIVTARDRQARDQAPTEIRSDYFEMLDSEVTNFSGSAELTKADQKLWGDFVTRNTRTNAVNAHGNVIYQEKGLSLSSDTAFLDTDTDRGVYRNSQFILPAVPARGTSRLTHADSSTLSRYETVTYTTCPPGNQDWLLHATNVKINKETGAGTARNAWFEFKDVPIFYTPYMSFPVDQRRMSGFLNPSLGVTRYAGFNFSLPYYFNLAPNYDYTAMPRYLVKRGFQLNNEFRYLTEMTRGRIVLDIVPEDTSAESDNAEIDAKNRTENQDLPHIPTTRGQAALLNDTRFTENLTAHIDGNYVSDYRYLNQYGSPLALVDRRNIRSIGYLNYAGDNYSIRAQADYYQTIDPTIIQANAQPYFHLPEIAFNYFNSVADTGLQFDTQVLMDAFETTAGATSFVVTDPATGGATSQSFDKTTGQRLKLRPRLSYPIQSAAGFITPSFTLLHNEYWLQNPEYWTQLQKQLWSASGSYNSKTGNSETLTAPIFSLDSGAFFERDFELASTPMLQTLEPRLFYVYIPTVKQDDIPVFDSSAYDFTFYQLFRENRFTGSDRIGDANQLTAALTSRFIDQSSGLERLRASVGNIFYFQDRQVTLSGPPPDTQAQSNSNVVAELAAGITNDWSFRTGGQWNPDRDQIDRGIVALQYNNRQNQILNLAYRYRRNQYTLDCIKGDPNNGCLDLTDVSFRLPVTQGWHVIGRWQYSLQDQLTLESFLGVERETCCWRFTLLGRHYVTNIESGGGQNQGNNGVFVQLELKGLTTLGDQVDQFLRREISGYRYRDDY